MDEKISVIVPIYKVEQYLNRCVDSIINQTYTNLEIILVDDGSPDNCPKICDEYIKKDNRIKVIHKKNGGLSDARNAGLKVATGYYISFIDSDDWIDLNMYKNLINLLVEYNADIVECEVKYAYDDDIYIENNYNNIKCLDKISAHKALIKNEIRQTVWNKIYKAQIVKNVEFEKGKYNEDEFWTYKIIDLSKKIVKTSEIYYYYFQRPGSIMNSKYSIKNLDGLEAKYRRLNFLSKYPDVYLEAKKHIVFDTLYNYQKVIKNFDYEDRIKFSKLIKQMYKIVKNDKVLFREYKLKEKIWYLISNISLELVCRIRNYFNIGV